MTVLNLTPLKGVANWYNKWKKCKIYYALHGNGELVAIVDFGYGMGMGGACIVENNDRVIAMGYLFNLDKVKPYKYELQRDKRGL